MNIRANAGALTQGVSTDTIDGFSIERAEKLAKHVRSREYVAKPVRRVQIPKRTEKPDRWGFQVETINWRKK
ncbi:hypothetical protein ACVV4G_28225 [Escherichia coli]